ncbi:MAG: Clp protease N-terminal domain-containing protein [Gemmatimonadaceae bacterium]
MDWKNTAWLHARNAMEAGDLESLKRVVATHPELLHIDDRGGRLPTLLNTALAFEKSRGIETMRPIMDWLVTQGLDLQRALNEQLSGHIEKSPENVRWLLDRGADPNWVDPNGIAVLEYALVNYWDGEAVDVLAARARPRRALWISAGLGDVDGVRRSLDRNGKPTKEARRLRPPFHAAARGPVTAHPDPDDEEILVEAFVVAMLNGRTGVLEYMVSRGFPLNSMTYGIPMICFAVGNGWPNVVASLVRCGADLDLKGWRPEQSAREMAREFLESAPDNTDRRRIAELCGVDVDAIVAGVNARPPRPPVVHPFIEKALDLASDDATRVGRSEIDAENLLYGLLRIDESSLAWTFTRATGMDVDRFRDEMSERLRPAEDRLARTRLPLRADGKAAIDAAIAAATERREELVNVMHVTRELLRDERGPACELLRRYGGDASKLIAQLELGHAPVQMRSKPRESRGSMRGTSSERA